MILIDVTLLFFSRFNLGGSALFDALHASMSVIQGLAINPHFVSFGACNPSSVQPTQNSVLRFVQGSRLIDRSNLYFAHYMYSALLIRGAPLHDKRVFLLP